MLHRLQVRVEFVHQRDARRDVQPDDLLVGHVVEILHERAQAVAVRRDQHLLAARTAGAIVSCQYGRKRATVSFRHSVSGSSSGERSP